MTCGIGERGELFVTGICVGLGYAGDPEATAAAFLEAEIGGERALAYRTGDLATITAEGVLVVHPVSSFC